MKSSGKDNEDFKIEKEDPLTVNEIERIAQKKLPHGVWNYYACGSDDEHTLQRNIDAFNSLYICPRVLRNVSSISTATEILGIKYPLPVGIAPSAMQKLVGGEGEMDVARAACNLGINVTLSSQSTTSLEEVMSVKQDRMTGPEFWFQIYLTSDLEKSVPLIRRAEAAGYQALVLTVDTPVLGNRINERKVPLALPSNLRLANIESSKSLPSVRKPTFNRLLMDARTAREANEVISSAGGSMHSSSLTWENTIPFLRRTSPAMKIILKGIMTPEDAQLAIEYNADAIVVSNHGGRQLDSVASALDVLPDIVKVVAGRIPILIDGGVRRGSDVFKALALGADFVLVGRPVLWGLSLDGRKGVETVLNILERELCRTMALAGVSNISDIRGTALHVLKRGGFGVCRI